MAKFEAICYDVKKLDQCSVHLYAFNTEITCKSLVNDLGIIISNKLKWDSHINQRLSKAQQKLFFLEEKHSLFYKYENKSKFIQKLHFINSPLPVKCMVLNGPICRKLEKMQRRALKWSLNKKFLRTNCNWKKLVKLEVCFVLGVVKYANFLTQRNDTSTFDWTCPIVLFRKQLNSFEIKSCEL